MLCILKYSIIFELNNKKDLKMFQKLNEALDKTVAVIRDNTNIRAALLMGVMAITMAPAGLMAAEHRETIRAHVISSEPVYKNVRVIEDVEVCDEVRRQVAKRGEASSGAGETVTGIFGAIIGGVAGHQIGGGMGKNIATGAGAVLGMLGGQKLAQANASDKNVFEVSQECHMVQQPSTSRVLDGYNVKASLPNGDTVFGKIKELRSDIDVEATTTYRIK
jgi:uncharacterized protein YcfJ